MQQDFIKAVAAQLEDEARVSALFLAGSHGASAADAFSDIDFVMVAAAEDHAALADLWRGIVGGIEPVVFWAVRSGRATLLNAVTESWVRVDLLIVTPDALGWRSKESVKALIDRAGLFAGLQDVLPAAKPDAVRMAATINEFIRILGLLPVGLGRQEYVLLVKGAGLLRDLLMDLMLEDCPLADRGGALHLRRLLTPAQMAVIEGLPYPGPAREAVIAAHQGVAAVFFPLAREMAGRLEVAWPDAFEAALWRRLADVPGMARV